MDSSSFRITHINLASGLRGGEKQTLLLMKVLSERGFSQSLICRKNSELKDKSSDIINLEIQQTGLNPFSHIKFFLDRTILHFHESRGFFALWLSSFFIKHNYIITRRVQRSPSKIFYNKSIYRDANAIVALTKSISKSIKKNLQIPLDYKIIPSAYSSLNYSRSNVETIKSSFENKFIIGHIGALDDSHKGQNQIFSVAERIQYSHPNIIFLLVGRGRDIEKFNLKASQLENIKLVGHVENVEDYLKAFDIFLFPSRHEGLGSTLLDALAFGLPIIASNVGGIPEIIEDNHNGFLIEVDAIDDYISSILSLYSNEELYEKIKSNNIKKSKIYTKDRMTDAYIEIYKNISAPINE